MSRLTDPVDYCWMKCYEGDESVIQENCKFYPCFEKKMWDKLNHYEDLEEAGRLIELPCAIGDTTYWIGTEDEDGNEGLCVMESEPIRGILCTKDGFYVEIDTRTFSKVGSSDCLLTRAEAEKMLERMQCNG